MRPENIMWNGTCNQLDYRGQLETAHLSGCDVLSITPVNYKKWRAEGMSIKDMRTMADDLGVRVSHLDPLATWAPEWEPDNVEKEFLPFFGMSVDEFLQCAEELECESFTAICTFPYGAVLIEELIESFAKLCRRAKGLRVDLEFVPLWGLRDLASAWKVVDAADAPNGGVMIDFWHFFRCNPDFDLLEQIPASKIHSVQACDARYQRAEGRTPLEDTLEDRLPLGEGEFPVDRILKVLAEKGALQRVGPEYFCKRLHRMSPAEIAEVVDKTYWTRVASFGVARAQPQDTGGHTMTDS